MTDRFIKGFACILFAFAAGCGEQLETDSFVSFQPPQGLKAFSVSESAVSLQWSPSPDAIEPTFLGYIVQSGVDEDSLAATVLTFLADSLPSGTRTFTIFSYSSDEPRSNGATIRWAPAARFDTPIVVSEFAPQYDPTTLAGLNVGSQSTDPSALALEPIDSAVINLMDLYLFGGSGQIVAPLALWNARLYRGDLRQTKFSTVSHSSSTLDFPLSSFPEIASFVRDTVIISDNTIYYARILGDFSDTLYARIHVKIVPGLSFPNRSVEIRVSLQRVPGVLFSCLPEEEIFGRREFQKADFEQIHNS